MGPRLLELAQQVPGGIVEQLDAGDADLWEHRGLGGGDFPAVIALTTPATRLVVFNPQSTAIYIGLGHTPSSSAGGYDLIHPGSGFLVFNVPPTTRFELVAAAALAKPVDVWLFAGSFAAR